MSAQGCVCPTRREQLEGGEWTEPYFAYYVADCPVHGGAEFDADLTDAGRRALEAARVMHGPGNGAHP